MVSYYRQRSGDIKMKSYMIKTPFVSTEVPKAMANKIGFNFRIFIFYKLSIIRFFNPADINRF